MPYRRRTLEITLWIGNDMVAKAQRGPGAQRPDRNLAARPYIRPSRFRSYHQHGSHHALTSVGALGAALTSYCRGYARKKYRRVGNERYSARRGLT
jgi:hypothetical protein